MKTRRCSISILVLVLGAVVLTSCDDHLLTPTDADETIPSPGSMNTTAASTTMQSGKLYRFADLSEVPDASASLLRNRSGLRVSIHTSDLSPGDAITIWWVVFNFPENCQHPVPGLMQCSEPDLFGEEVAPSVLYAAGHVIGGSGVGNFAASLRKEDVKGCQPPFDDFGLCGDGLLNPNGAEVHFVVRTHGPRLPGIVSDQIRTFAGGCTPETSFGAGTGPNECEDLQFSIFEAP